MIRFNLSQNINIGTEISEGAFDSALTLLLTRVRLRARRRIAWLRKLWSEEGESGGKLTITHAEIDAYLDDLDSPDAEAAWFASDESVRQWNREIVKIEAIMASDQNSRLAQLQKLFGLSEKEVDLFQTCLAVLLDPSLCRVYAYLHDHAGRGYATEELAARLFGYGRISLWSPESPLCRWGLIREKEVGPSEPPKLACDSLIRDWLQDHDYLDELLVGVAKVYPPLTPLKNWLFDENVAFVARMINSETPNPVRLCIEGIAGSGRRTLAAEISKKIGLSALTIDTDAIDDRNWQQVFIRAQRQAYLNHCALAWYGENALRRVWPQVVPFFPLQFVICEAGQMPLSITGIVEGRIEMPIPSLRERHELWERFMPVTKIWPTTDFIKLVEQHRVTIGEIVAIAQRDVQSVKEATALVREAARYRLGDLAQWLECPFSMDDLVVMDSLREALEDLAFEARERVAFWERPEAMRLFPQGQGLLSLFSGPPGTGKTMAAQVIAADLGLDLFRIDLSAVVSKYVGETSQNLERILSRAAQMDIVLLFDEADALFGKRTEIKDAHDRFANTDTGYLLQAIENYRGVALLATNKKGNIDSAFIRRIRYVLEFPKPDAKQREEIWRKIVGELTGTDRLNTLAGDLKTLASDLELTGAQIKYAVLAALFVAKRDSEPLAMKHLLRGLDRELMKEGRPLSGRDRERLLK